MAAKCIAAKNCNISVHQGQKHGKIDAAEYKIIKNAFDFSEQTAKQIMVPRIQVVGIDVNDFNDKTIDFIIEQSYTTHSML